MASIDLGMPGHSLAEPTKPAEGEADKHYPNVFMEADGEPFKHIPEEGVMVVHHRVTERAVHTNADGKKRSTMHVEIHKIVSAKPHKEKSPAESLDELAQEKSKSK